VGRVHDAAVRPLLRTNEGWQCLRCVSFSRTHAATVVTLSEPCQGDPDVHVAGIARARHVT
jgi:hypothetical protein